MVYIRSILDKSRVRLRVIEGQKYKTTMNVQGSKDIRLSNPVGTIFCCDNLVEAGSFYRAVGQLRVARDVPVQYDPTVTKTRRTKLKDQPINIVEFV